MTVQTISELWGWRPPAEWELRFIESSVGGGQRKDSRSRMITGILCLMFAFCIRTDHRVDGNSISRIRVRDKVGQECAQWLNAPRSLARSFDAQAQREQVPVPVFPVLIAAWEGQYRVLPPVGPR